jgi:hypothetical protein
MEKCYGNGAQVFNPSRKLFITKQREMADSKNELVSGGGKRKAQKFSTTTGLKNGGEVNYSTGREDKFFSPLTMN